MGFDKSFADATYLRGKYKEFASLCYEGARDGSDIAAFNYGYCLYKGIGVDKNYEEAKSFFSFARELAGGEACYNLAIMHMEGQGTEKSYHRALRYMHDAADMGCIEAQLYLGMAYTLGYLLYPDIVLISMVPFHKAEMRDMTLPLLSGEVIDDELDEELRFSVIKADARRAFEYFREAANHSPDYVEELVAKGQFLSAKCYVDGMGVDFDRNKSLRLMLLAGKNGSNDAVEYLASNGITEQMLLEAVRDGKKNNSDKH